MELRLTQEEFELLTEVLQEKHASMAREIRRADYHEFKEMLKHRERRLEAIMDKLGVAVAA